MPFDGNLSDFTNNNHTITNVGVINYAQDRLGRIDRAASFSGINNYIEVSNNNGTLSTRTEMSFSFKFKTFSSNTQTILTKINYSTAHQREYQVAIKWSQNPRALFGVSATNNQDCLVPIIHSDYISTGINIIDTNQWYCLAGTYGDDSLEIYLDGILLDVKRVTGLLDSCGNIPLRIGQWAQMLDQSFQGYLDELRLYNRILKIEEIETLCAYYSELPESVSESATLKRLITISPNPTSNGIINISTITPVNKATTITLFDVQGRKLNEFNLNTLNNYKLDISNFAKGLYFVEIRTGNANAIEKIILE